MKPLSYIYKMLSEYQSVFKYNNFKHFQAVVMGLIFTPHRGTMTQIYQSTRPATTYWALAKFLSRSQWCLDTLTSVLTQLCWLNTMDTTSNTSSEIENEVPDLESVLQILGIHWYRPKYLTRGLMVAFLRHLNLQKKIAQ